MRINPEGDKIGVLPGFVLQGAPEAGAAIGLEIPLSRLVLLGAGEKEVEGWVGDNNIVVGRVTLRIEGGREIGLSVRGQMGQDGELVIQSDGTKAELSDAGAIFHGMATEENAGTDRPKKDEGVEAFKR